jgi:NADPH:quinone reductase-like Zn-dependent oxidoreductase
VDVVFDCVGGEVMEKSADIVRKGGRLISIVDDPSGLDRNDITTEFVFVAPNSSQLTEISQMVEQGRLQTQLSAVLPLEEAKKAHELSESMRTQGKIVLVIS